MSHLVTHFPIRFGPSRNFFLPDPITHCSSHSPMPACINSLLARQNVWVLTTTRMEVGKTRNGSQLDFRHSKISIVSMIVTQVVLAEIRLFRTDPV
jgi:hypothetical protein